jgi:hypothetical protein
MVYVSRICTLKKNGYTLAVPTKMSVKELFEIKKIFQGLDLQVTEQNQQWNEALEKISTK